MTKHCDGIQMVYLFPYDHPQLTPMNCLIHDLDKYSRENVEPRTAKIGICRAQAEVVLCYHLAKELSLSPLADVIRIILLHSTV